MAPAKKRASVSKSKKNTEASADTTGLSNGVDLAADHSATPRRSTRASTKAQTKEASPTEATQEVPTGVNGSFDEDKAPTKRKRAEAAKPKILIDVNTLPHGLDTAATKIDKAADKDEAAEVAPAAKRKSAGKPAPKQEKIIATGGVSDGDAVKKIGTRNATSRETDGVNGEATVVSTKKQRARKTATKTENDMDGEAADAPAEKSRTRKAAKPIKDEDQEANGESKLENTVDNAEDSPAKARKAKRPEQYGVQLGVTPYPDLIHPTPEECHAVNKLLSEKHGHVKPPEAPPVPSREVAGCGEVKCVLEALIRTYISSHTSMGNANRAISGLLKRYPTIEDGPGKGSVIWNEVRLASREDLEKAIREGGMAPTKSKHIKAILDMVYEENQSMRAEIAAKQARGSDAPTVATAEKPLPGNEQGAAAMARLADEILTTSPDALTLDYLHALGAEEAFMKLLPYPGIGIKTAACTLLFCMQRPCFAVDTHVFRLCKWLGWVPANATRDTTFAHCDVRVPDELKYSLHQLLIAHGKSCGRCRAITGEKSAEWEDAECPLEELVTRTGKKKGGVDSPTKRKRKRASEEGQDEDDEGADEGAEGFKTEDMNGDVVSDESPPKKKRASKKEPATAKDEEDFKPSKRAARKPKAAKAEPASDSATKPKPVANGAAEPSTKQRAAGKAQEAPKSNVGNSIKRKVASRVSAVVDASSDEPVGIAYLLKDGTIVDVEDEQVDKPPKAGRTKAAAPSVIAKALASRRKSTRGKS